MLRSNRRLVRNCKKERSSGRARGGRDGNDSAPHFASSSLQLPLSPLTEVPSLVARRAEEGATPLDRLFQQAVRSMRLIITQRRLRELPPALCERYLASAECDLVCVDLSGNSLQSIPTLLCERQATSLQTLVIAHNRLCRLPDSSVLSTLAVLSFLDLSGNNLVSVPAALFSLPRLEVLLLGNNYIEELPLPVVGAEKRNTSLHELDLSQNRLVEVPIGCMKTLHSLRVLNLSNNRLRELPHDLPSCLPSLARLDLSCNDLAHIPSSFHTFFPLSTDPSGSTRRLELLTLEQNPLLSPPLWVVASGTEYLAGWLRDDASRRKNHIVGRPTSHATQCERPQSTARVRSRSKQQPLGGGEKPSSSGVDSHTTEDDARRSVRGSDSGYASNVDDHQQQPQLSSKPEGDNPAARDGIRMADEHTSLPKAHAAPTTGPPQIKSAVGVSKLKAKQTTPAEARGSTPVEQLAATRPSSRIGRVQPLQPPPAMSTSVTTRGGVRPATAGVGRIGGSRTDLTRGTSSITATTNISSAANMMTTSTLLRTKEAKPTRAVAPSKIAPIPVRPNVIKQQGQPTSASQPPVSTKTGSTTGLANGDGEGGARPTTNTRSKAIGTVSPSPPVQSPNLTQQQPSCVELMRKLLEARCPNKRLPKSGHLPEEPARLAAYLSDGIVLAEYINALGAELAATGIEVLTPPRPGAPLPAAKARRNVENFLSITQRMLAGADGKSDFSDLTSLASEILAGKTVAKLSKLIIELDKISN